MIYKKTTNRAAILKPVNKKIKAGVGPRAITSPKTMPARKMLLGGRKPSTMAGKAKRR
jgi:hypothetical protein